MVIFQLYVVYNRPNKLPQKSMDEKSSSSVAQWKRMCIKGPHVRGTQPVLHNGSHYVQKISGMLRSDMTPMML
jgi:hypothetical protein